MCVSVRMRVCVGEGGDGGGGVGGVQHPRVLVLHAARTYIEVETGASQVEAHVPGERGLRRFGLKPARRLLCPNASFRHEVARHSCVPRKITRSAVKAVHTAVRNLVRAAPCCHGGAARPPKCVAVERGIAVEAGQHEAVAAHAAEVARRHK